VRHAGSAGPNFKVPESGLQVPLRYEKGAGQG
jgi:hypothetical protein